MMKSLVSRLIISIALVMSLAACSSSKRSADAGSTGYEKVDAKLSHQAEALVATYGAWTNLSVPMKLQLDYPKNITLSGRAYMVKGKSVMLSLKFLGMEVATIYITNDSIYAAEKIRKNYIAEEYRSLLGDYPMNITEIQDMLIGRAFVVGGGTLSRNNLDEVKLAKGAAAGTLSISPKQAVGGIGYQMDVAVADNSLRSLTVSADGKRPVVCDYSSPVLTPYGNLSEAVSLDTPIGQGQLKCSLRWNFKSATWNSKDIREWSTPRGYNRVTKGDLISILTSF